MLKNYEKKGKRKLRDNLDDDKKEQVKESDKIRKKQMHDNLGDDRREQIRYNDKKRKKNQHIEIKNERKQVFDNAYRRRMFDPFILTTEEDFKSAIQEGFYLHL